MSQVLNKVRDVDPNDSEAVKDVLNVFFQNLTKTVDSDPIKWLRMLGDIINRFPKYCMSHRTIIEKVISESIDSNDYYYVIEAAKCAQALQQVRPSQEKTATPKTSWLDQMSLLCKAAHSLITVIFPTAIDMYKDIRTSKDQESSSTLKLTSTLLNIKSISGTQNKGEKQVILQSRLRNVFCFIQAMLVEIYPVAKPVRPQIILDVVIRALSVSSGSKNANLAVALVKVEALRTLDALVACLGPNFIQFSPLVFRLLMQTFRWTSENPDKDFSNIRCATYSSLGKWLVTLHSHRSPSNSRSSWEDELTDYIIKDIAQPTKIVQLTMGPPPAKNVSKKIKRKLANANLLESSIASHIPGEKNKISKPEEVNNSVALAALTCAEIFLIVCGRFLKPATHKIFQEQTIRECYKSHQYNEEQLLSLLRVLEASRKTTPANVPPPTQYCLQLYSELVNYRHGEISKFCTQALLDIRLHLHCSPPSLNFTLEAPQQTQGTNKRKTVSDKNLAALQSLIGSERISALRNQDVITIPDEPSSKKARVAEETDKISLSSDSINSIEISDDSDIEEVKIDEKDGGQTEETPNKTETIAVENTIKTVELVSDGIPNNAIKSTPTNITDETMEEVTIGQPGVVVDSKNTQAEIMEHMLTAPVQEKEKNKEIDVVNVQDKEAHDVSPQIPKSIPANIVAGEEARNLSSKVSSPNLTPTKANVLTQDSEIIVSNNTDCDDVPITCGQIVKSSQETNPENTSGDTNAQEIEENIVRKVNGNIIVKNGVNIPAVNDKSVGDENPEDIKKEITKTESNDNDVTIETMMADFVDEVNVEFT